MSETAAKPRQPVDLGEFERRLRGPERARASQDDPLAELARLVDKGQIPLTSETVRAPVGVRQGPILEPHFAEADLAPAVETRQQPAASQAGYEAAAPQTDWNHVMNAWEAEKANALGSPVGAAAHHQGEFHHPQTERPGAAESGYDPAAAYPYDELPPPPAEPAPQRSRMGAYAMAGALGVVALGVAGTFAMKSGPAGSRDAPMIKAATGPAKVQPEATSTAALSQNASVLDKGAEKLTTSKIVGTVEQPVDVGAQIRQPKPAPGVAATPAGSSIFPEPRRVKTVSVRPDGSIISADIPVATTGPANSAAAVPVPRPSSAATGPSAPTRSIASPSTPPVAAPKVTARVAARTPAPADDDDDTPVAKPSAKPIVKSVPKTTAPAPKAAVDPKPAGGGFAVQMGVAGSDAEARAKVNQVQAKYGSNLGGRRASVVKAEVNGKTVYRVRVVGLSQEGAADICGKVKGGGGDCFVAR